MTTCLKCGSGATCDCYLVGSGLVTVTGVGSDADPYIADVSCQAVLGCMGVALANVGFSFGAGTILAGGAAGEGLTATSPTTADWETIVPVTLVPACVGWSDDFERVSIGPGWEAFDKPILSSPYVQVAPTILTGALVGNSDDSVNWSLAVRADPVHCANQFIEVTLEDIFQIRAPSTSNFRAYIRLGLFVDKVLGTHHELTLRTESNGSFDGSGRYLELQTRSLSGQMENDYINGNLYSTLAFAGATNPTFVLRYEVYSNGREVVKLDGVTLIDGFVGQALTFYPYQTIGIHWDNGTAVDDATFVSPRVLSATGGGSVDFATPPPPVQPANDDFAAATTIVVTSPGTIVGSIANSTLEPSEYTLYMGRYQSVWYKFTSPTSRSITLDTTLSAQDTTMQLFTGSTLASLTLVASDDDSGGAGYSSLITYAITAGIEYHLQIAAYQASSQTFSFTLRWN